VGGKAMNKRKILFIFVLIILIVIIGILLYMKFSKKEENVIKEITPLEEVTEEQERETIISLYFTNPETKTLAPEARKIDAKELIENPYKKLIELLIEGAKSDKLVSSIPEGTKVNNAVLKNGVVELDLSKEFVENQKGDKTAAELSIYAIVNTLSELNEVNAIKILINGDGNKKFNNIDLKLNENFTRQD